jgi:hypothetical protein
MKRIAVLPLAAALLVATAPAALARADSYYTVICDGIAYESVDAHAIDQGHKWDAIQNFMHNTPFGMSCTLSVKVNP